MNIQQNLNEPPLVIRASAGTGKTYRLSLEFIDLLLRYRVSFDEILVITFTKKATAEIRERIFSQLYQIINDTAVGKELKQNIKNSIDSNITFNEEEISFLTSVYKKMITNKSNVKISTIDSFVNTIFTGIIAPYRNITDFAIDKKINSEILPEIYEHILQDKNLENYRNIFLQSKRRNLEQFKDLILSFIENRWLFEFIDLSEFQDIDFAELISNAFSQFYKSLKNFLEMLQAEIVNYTKPCEISDLLQKDFATAIAAAVDLSKLQKNDLCDSLLSIVSDKDFLNDHFNLLLEDRNIWNGSRIRNKELKTFFHDVQKNLADLLFFDKAVTEQFNLISLAADIMQIYDEIKFRDKIFTHSDISYYTFKFLYDPELSIIEKGNVLNIFYEQLSYNSRFILIDEFQDTSILQWSIFYPMLKEITSGIGQKEYGKIIVVGDEKQAIYGWRGGERKLLTAFNVILNEHVEYDTLSTSYRSKPVLMNWLNKLFKSEILNAVNNWDYTKIDCSKSVGGYVQVDLRNATEDDRKLEKTEIYQEYVQQYVKPNLDSQKIDPAETAIIMRTNKELDIMAQVLQEAGIDYTLDMSGSLFQHKAIKPLLFALNFIVYDDFMELIKFLRSDLALIEPTQLKQIIDNYNSSDSLADLLQNSNLHPYLNKLFKLKHQKISILILIKSILEEFSFNKIYHSEMDLKNLQRFLEVAAEFERANHQYTKDVAGFLQYCRALSEKDEYSQIGQSVSNSIKLMTIHKSKGLEFETVFTVFDVTGRSGGNQAGLKLYYKFAENFRNLEDFAFTYNYNKILKKSDKSSLIDHVEARDFSDELNNIYVAFTRAKNNLFVLLHYNKKGDLTGLFNNSKTKDSVTKLIARSVYTEFNDDLIELSSVSHQLSYGNMTTEPKVDIEKNMNDANLHDFFQIHEPVLQDLHQPNLLQLANEFLQNKSILIGNITHEFLSHIKYLDDGSLELAEKRIVSKYGSLIRNEEFQTLLNNIRKFILENSCYFDRSKWDKVFNEYIVFDENDREFRIDRMMVDTKNREILIIDYKTGSIEDLNQLDRYERIVEGLEVVKNDKYSINSEFIEININQEIDNE